MEFEKVLISIILIVFSFVIGSVVGENSTQNRYKEKICSQVYTNLLDYKECKSKNLDDVIEKIPKIKGGDNNEM